MAGASRPGYYSDHRGDCRASTLSQDLFRVLARGGLAGFRRGREAVRRKVSGETRTEVKDKLKALHSELDAGVRSAAGYTVEKAAADWLDEGLPAHQRNRIT
jgi:hypothetical protein